jgi:hypothetical protein
MKHNGLEQAIALAALFDPALIARVAAPQRNYRQPGPLTGLSYFRRLHVLRWTNAVVAA